MIRSIHVPRSTRARKWMEEEGINWWKTPAESPDINPIENLWHELKEYLRREIKPKTKEQLISGIETNIMNTSTCTCTCTLYMYIHLHKNFLVS